MSNSHCKKFPIVIYAQFTAIHSDCTGINRLALSTVLLNLICFIPIISGSTCRAKYCVAFMPQWCRLWECSTKSLLALDATVRTESAKFFSQCFGTRFRPSALFSVAGTRNTFHCTFYASSVSRTITTLPQNLSLLQYLARSTELGKSAS